MPYKKNNTFLPRPEGRGFRRCFFGEIAQIAHAKAYAQLYASAGVPGHGQFLLIAKLAEALGL